MTAKYESVTCPFCGETDFDPIGLKNHFTAGYCEIFNALPAVRPPLPAAMKPAKEEKETK